MFTNFLLVVYDWQIYKEKKELPGFLSLVTGGQDAGSNLKNVFNLSKHFKFKVFPCSDPERAAQLCIRQLCGQFEVLKADSLSGSLVPGEQHGQLERRHLQVVLTHFVFKGDLSRETKEVRRSDGLV